MDHEKFESNLVVIPTKEISIAWEIVVLNMIIPTLTRW